jgi:hypothetical protein
VAMVRREAREASGQWLLAQGLDEAAKGPERGAPGETRRESRPG